MGFNFIKIAWRNLHRFKIYALLNISGLAIFNACLGLFGLAAFMIQRRTHEIGIRKVIGASSSSLVILMAREFTKWVIIANLIAWPIAWFSMDQWLNNFAYRVPIAGWLYLVTGIITLAIALLTISYQSVKLAIKNPVQNLRYE